MEDKSFKRCKKLMIFFNVLFLLGGLALLALGIWIVVDYQTFTGIFTSNTVFENAAYIIIVVGAAIALVSFCGCCGAWKESKCLLIIFATLMIAFLLVETAAIVLALAFSSSFDTILRDAALPSIESYGSNVAITSGWDSAHTAFSCCGYNGGTDFESTSFASSSNTLQPWPESCCTRVSGSNAFVDRNSCLESASVNPAHTYAQTGCYTALRNAIRSYSVTIGGVTAAVMVIQMLAVIFSCCVASNIGSNKVSDGWN